MFDFKSIKYSLKFNFPGGTSRGVLHTKSSWFIKLIDVESGRLGIGECSYLEGLNPEKPTDYPEIFSSINVNLDLETLDECLVPYPSIRFGVEMALKDLQSGGNKILFESAFTNGIKDIPINGLIWMGDRNQMFDRIKEKMDSGFRCLKLKIGAIDFNEEISLLKYIRSNFSKSELEIRVDANGAFHADKALDKLQRLSAFHIHSIEQPIAVNQWDEMAVLCEKSPIPIALDEELIGRNSEEERRSLLAHIQAQYLILKPSLLGGFKASSSWIELAEKNNTRWWVTSALESNIGLNAIAQWVASLDTSIPQGLGTGQVFSNNFTAPLQIKNAALHYNQDQSWDVKALGL